MELNRLPEESFKHYHIRLYDNRKEYGLSLEDVANLLNEDSENNFSESKWRKDYASAVEWKDHWQAEIADVELLDKLDEKTLEMEKIKVQMQDKTREYKKYLRHDGRVDNLLEKLLDAVMDDMNNKKPLTWIKPKENNSGKGSLVLLLSDFHKGMVTDNHWNKFNDEIFYERLNQVMQEVIEYQQMTQVENLHVMGLGDLIEGTLHRLTKIGETETAVQQTQAVAEALSELLSVLSECFNEVHFYSVAGNHDRTASRKEEEIRTESFHQFIPWYIKARLVSHKNITIHENEYDSEIIVADIDGNTYFGVHGHLDRVGNQIQDLTLMIKKFPTAIFSGHIHKNFENEIHSIDQIVNGGFAGTNDYAKDGRWTSKAHQKLLWVNENGRRATFYITFK